MRQVLNTDQAPAPVGPYNQSISANGTLYVSGQVAIDPTTGDMLQESIEVETKQVMRNIGAILKTAGLSYEDILMCNVFVTDMNNYGRINTIYAEFFNSETAPARALVEVSRLPKDANVEISVTATLK
ncbi:MAG: RidA family protein [Bacteroidetes bacterium]|nr:MAG: RidA family protein [Bacteroidota bacterium]